MLLLITGAFANASTLEGLQSAFLGLDVLRSHLPGNHSPELTETSVAAYSLAYSAAISALLQGRKVVVVGQSVGGAVALGIRAPEVLALVLSEPLLLNRRVWPLLAYRTQTPPGGEAFTRNVLGVTETGLEPRDFTGPLADLTIPTTAMFGDLELWPVRDLGSRMPSVATKEVLDRLRAHPFVEVVRLEGAGHNLAAEATTAYVGCLRAAATRAFA